jgi:hypothetical protein
LKHLATIIAMFACSLAAQADSLRGVVRNGTTDKPSAGDEVSLKRIGNGMEDAGQTRTNAKGEFSFDVPAGPTPYIIWVKHQNVNYTNVVQPGAGTAAITVFDAAAEVKAIKISEHMKMIQADAGTLKVDELYTLENNSTPPRTKSGQRAFEIYLPDGATVQDADAQVPRGMPLKAGLAPTGEKNQYGFAYPIRPGQTQFHISYTLPYTGRLQLVPRIPSPIDHMLVVVPSSINIIPAPGAVFVPKTDPRINSMKMLVASNVTPQQQLAFEIEGSGLMPRDEQQAAAPGQSNPDAGEDNRPGGGLGVPNEKPDPLHSGQWAFLGVLSAFLALGAVLVYVSNRPRTAAAPAGPQNRPAMLLEAMKEEIFQLETDRLQGKISAKDYEVSKAALDKTLERAVKRQKSESKAAPSA